MEIESSIESTEVWISSMIEVSYPDSAMSLS